MVTPPKAVSPWMRGLAMAIVAGLALYFADDILVPLIGSAKPNPHTGQIYGVSAGRGHTYYVELWLAIFHWIATGAVSLAILAVLCIGFLAKGRSKGTT